MGTSTFPNEGVISEKKTIVKLHAGGQNSGRGRFAATAESDAITSVDPFSGLDQLGGSRGDRSASRKRRESRPENAWGESSEAPGGRQENETPVGLR